MNYYPQRDGHFEELDNRELTTSEWVQSRLKGSQVVKVFNNIDQFHLQYGARPADDATRWALPIAGDSEAKAQVSKFVDAIGFDPVDCGALDESWRFQQNTPVYCTPYIGEWPEGARGDKMLEWVKTDHSKAVKTQDVLELLAQANKLDPVGGVINLPPEYASLFAGVRAMQQQM
ncbi:oxidoreductase [Phytophthora cinnamomi]|nr:oxidoreductase [Phytophthora cinnamomi]